MLVVSDLLCIFSHVLFGIVVFEKVLFYFRASDMPRELYNTLVEVLKCLFRKTIELVIALANIMEALAPKNRYAGSC